MTFSGGFPVYFTENFLIKQKSIRKCFATDMPQEMSSVEQLSRRVAILSTKSEGGLRRGVQFYMNPSKTG